MSFPFKSCAGLKIERAVIELEEGGFNGTTRKLVGPTKFPNIVLKQGFCSVNSELWKLRQEFMNDLPPTATSTTVGWKTPKRFTGTIIHYGREGAEAKYCFTQGWIAKWEGPDLDASKNEVSIESVEIAHSGLVLLSPASQANNQQPAQQSAASPPTNDADESSGSGSTGRPPDPDPNSDR
jgi:phage tail-like protein